MRAQMNDNGPAIARFDSEFHEYFANEEKVPSITQMLERVGMIDDRFYSEECAERGTLVHSLTAQFDLGAISAPAAMECIWKGYVLAHIAAMRTMKPEILSVEVARVSMEHRFGGRPDRTLRLWGALGVLDIKTGVKADWHSTQTALQSLLVAPEFGLPASAVQRHGLYLKKNGRWSLIEHTDKRDFTKAYEVLRTCCRAAT